MIGKPTKMPLIWLTLFLFINLSRCSNLKSTFLFMGVFGGGCPWSKGKGEERERMNKNSRMMDTDKIIAKSKNYITNLKEYELNDSQSSWRNDEVSYFKPKNEIRHPTFNMKFAETWKGANENMKSFTGTVGEILKSQTMTNGVSKLVDAAEKMGNLSRCLGILGVIPSMATMFFSFNNNRQMELLQSIDSKLTVNFVVGNAHHDGATTAANYNRCMSNFNRHISKIDIGIHKMEEYINNRDDYAAKEFLEVCGYGACDESLLAILKLVTNPSMGVCNALDVIYDGNPTKPYYYYPGSTDHWVKMTAELMELVTMGTQIVSLYHAFSIGVDKAVKKVAAQYGSYIERLAEEIRKRSKKIIDPTTLSKNIFSAAEQHFNGVPMYGTECEHLVKPLYTILHKNFGSEAYIIVQCQKQVDGDKNHIVTEGQTMSRDYLWNLDGKNINVAYIPKNGNTINSGRTALKSFSATKVAYAFGHVTEENKIIGSTLEEDLRSLNQEYFDWDDRDFKSISEDILEKYQQKGEHLEIIGGRYGGGWWHYKDPELSDRKNFRFIKGDTAERDSWGKTKYCGNWIVFGWKE